MQEPQGKNAKDDNKLSSLHSPAGLQKAGSRKPPWLISPACFMQLQGLAEKYPSTAHLLQEGSSSQVEKACGWSLSICLFPANAQWCNLGCFTPAQRTPRFWLSEWCRDSSIQDLWLLTLAGSNSKNIQNLPLKAIWTMQRPERNLWQRAHYFLHSPWCLQLLVMHVPCALKPKGDHLPKAEQQEGQIYDSICWKLALVMAAGIKAFSKQSEAEGV